MKVIRAAAGGHAFRQSLGSLDLVFDLGEFSLQDPAERVLLEHWITFAAFIPSLSKEVFLKSWEVSWTRLRASPHPWKAASGPMAALQRYLMDLTYEAKNFLHWQYAGQGPKPHCELDVTINLDGSAYVQDVAYKLRQAGLSCSALQNKKVVTISTRESTGLFSDNFSSPMPSNPLCPRP